MSSAPIATPSLSDTQIAELLETLKGADSVELKLTVPEPHQRSATTALELDPLEAQIRQVFFFDTPDLALDASGVVVRARRIQGKGGDSIVKLRPVTPSELREVARILTERYGGRTFQEIRTALADHAGPPEGDRVVRVAGLLARKVFTSLWDRNLYIGGAGRDVPGYINLDLFPMPGVDLAADAEALPFPDGLFTRIECDAVLD